MPSAPRQSLSALILPGLDGGRELLLSFQRALESHLPTHVHEYSTRQARPYRELQQRVRDSIAKSAEDTLLIAESFSGPIAIELAANPPKKLKAVVLVATFARSPVPRALSPFLRRQLFERPPPAVVVRTLMLGSEATDDDVRNVQSAVRRVDGGVLAARAQMVLSADVTAELARIALPILYIRPTSDRLVRRPLHVSKRGPWKTVEIAGPHLILQSCPEECALAVAEFVDGLTSQ